MRRLAILATAATALLNGTAHADTAFDGFRDFCVANRGVAAAALASADAAGWQAVPPQLLTQMPGLQNADGRMQAAAGGGASVLLTALGTVPQIGSAHLCLVGVVPAGSSDLEGQLATFAGVPKQANPNMPGGFYAWRDDNGRHVPADPGAPGVLIATTQNTPQMTMIVLMSAAQ